MNEDLKLCPWCGGELEKGVLRSKRGAFFTPDSSKHLKMYLRCKAVVKKMKAIYLPPNPYDLDTYYPRAYACRHCKRIVVTYVGEWPDNEAYLESGCGVYYG